MTQDFSYRGLKVRDNKGRVRTFCFHTEPFITLMAPLTFNRLLLRPFARACISTSLGNVVCMRLDSEIALLEERVWTGAHEYGTWVAEFDRMNDNLIFSGTENRSAFVAKFS